MITVRTSPAYVNRVRQDWTANGGVYGDGGISAIVPSNDPFAQLGATLDLTFAGVPTNQLTAATTDGYSINLNLSSDIYQIAAQYVVWQSGVGMASVNFSDIVTFTRASTATYFDSTGTLQTATTNTARFDYNPSTLAAQGLLIEEQRTNSIRNNTMQGAVAGTPGTAPTNWATFGNGAGLNWNVAGVGIENGISYVDLRLSGTSTTTTQPLVRADQVYPAASTGQAWTHSNYIRVVAGSLTGITDVQLFVTEWTSGGAFVRQSAQTVSVSATTMVSSRQSITATLSGATTGLAGSQIGVTPQIGVAIDITLRIGLPQLEQGAFATSVIPTTTTALTRSADVASVNTLSPWYNATEGTLFAEFNIPSALTSGSGPRLFTLQGTGGAAVDEMPLFVVQATGKAVSFNAFTGGVNAGRMDASPAFVANTIIKAAATYATNARAVTAGGAVPTTSATVFTIPTITVARLGAQDAFGNSVLNGYLRRITYYPRRLPNADLQTITA